MRQQRLELLVERLRRPPRSSASAGGSAAVVKTATSATLHTTVLIDAQGMTLYHLSGESTGKFICTSAACVQVWHPVTVSGAVTPSGVSSLATVKRPDGTVQVTYKGTPLYTFSSDKAAGEDNGQGVKDVGTWTAVTTEAGRAAPTTPAATHPRGLRRLGIVRLGRLRVLATPRRALGTGDAPSARSAAAAAPRLSAVRASPGRIVRPMAHDHAAHSHGVGPDADRGKLALALGLIVAFMAVEVAAGVISHSLALLSDAGHMLADAAAIGFSLVALRLAARPARGAMTFGLRRLEILSAQANGVTLLVLAAFISYEAIRRLFAPAARARRADARRRAGGDPRQPGRRVDAVEGQPRKPQRRRAASSTSLTDLYGFIGNGDRRSGDPGDAALSAPTRSPRC